MAVFQPQRLFTKHYPLTFATMNVDAMEYNTTRNHLIMKEYGRHIQKMVEYLLTIKDKEELIDIGSTLHASNFSIVGVKEKSSGKEKETTTAKRVDKLRISFDLDENMLTQSGPKDIFISITAPDGSPIAVEALGSGKFVTREGIERDFTKKVEVDYKQGEKQKVNVEWKQDKDFQTLI